MKTYSKNLLSVVLLTLILSLLGSLHVIGQNNNKATTGLQSAKRIITGTVTSEVDDAPVIGAAVTIKGTTIGTIVNEKGQYSIQVNSGSDILEFSMLGYEKRSVPVEDLGVINVKLRSSNVMVDEMVIVGSGTQRKVSVTGAITTATGAELKTSTPSLTNALAGRLAGIIATTNSGEPGTGSSFYIRGISTFGGRSEPLIMLDDVEISSGDLNNLPSEIISSFSILKDASATAIYGSRGANGVMLITTKRGEENAKARIGVTIENTINKPMNFPEFADGATWMEMYNTALMTRSPQSTPFYGDEIISATRNKTNPYVFPDVDWADLMFKKLSFNQRANVNISGGGSKVTYYMSMNVNHDTGLLNSPKIYSWSNNIDRYLYNFQNNISYKVTSTTKIDLNMNAQIQNRTAPNYKTQDLFNLALTTDPIMFPPYFPAQEGDQHVRFGSAIRSGSSIRTNPYAYMVGSFAQQDANTLNTSLKVNQQLDFITKGLSIFGHANFKNWSSTSYNRTVSPYLYNVKDGSYDPVNNTYELTLLKEGTDYISQSDISRSGDRTIMLQAQLNYQRHFGKNNVSGMLMYMQRDYKSSVLPNRNQGISGRFTYDYSTRYLVEFNFGYNGSERLPKESRFKFFPAVSAGWVTSNEPFFQRVVNEKFIQHMKIRGSIGLVGSDQFNGNAAHFLYLSQAKLNATSVSMGDDWITKTGPWSTVYPVTNPRWEKSLKMDIGMDVMMFNSLNICIDFFSEKRTDILMQRASWPLQLGYGYYNNNNYQAYMPWSNIGAVDNKGFEFSANYKKDLSKDLILDLRANFTYTQNKYVNMDEPIFNYPWEMHTGTPLASQWGYIAEGLFQSQEEIDRSPMQNLGSTPMVGDIKYRDLNGDNKIDESDKAMISEYGNTPRIQFGFGANLTYKMFDFGIFLNGSAMRTIMVGDIHPYLQDPIRSHRNVFQFIADDFWSEKNPNAKYPRLGLTEADVKNNHVPSTFWMRNGNFLRLKTLELGYSFKAGRVFVNADNVAVFSPFKLWDPELSWNSYPLQRTISLGAQLKF